MPVCFSGLVLLFSKLSVASYFALVLFLYGVITWIRDWLRELAKKYTFIFALVMTLVGLVIAEETLTFVGLYWGYYHFMFSPTVMLFEGICTVDTLGLAYVNTLILLTYTILLGCIYWSCTSLSSATLVLIGSIVFVMFGYSAVLEYCYLGIHFNDVYVQMYMVTFVHLMHVVVGCTLLLCFCFYNILPTTTGRCTSVYVCGYYTIYTYWHFIELLWVGVFGTFYL